MEKKYLCFIAAACTIAATLVSCTKKEEPGLAVPEIVQSEQISDNPVTLSFSWAAVEGADSYEYELAAVEDETKSVITEGSTEKTSWSVASSKDVLLSFSTRYVFSVKAKSALAESNVASCEVTTSPAPFSMTITDLSYRGATFTVVAEDPSLTYITAQTEWEKFAKYGSDLEFIEDYDFGFYKQIPPIYIPWYAKMEGDLKKGEYSWTTRILTPGTSYIFYAYGVKMQTDNTASPVLVSTPLIKTRFTAPEFEPTSSTTFQVASVSQTIEGGKVVSTIKVTPSSSREKYLVAFAEDEYVNEKYNGSDFALMMGRMGDLEIMGTVKNYNWGASGLLHSGEITIANNATGVSLDANINPGKKYHAIVIGVTDSGIQTTELKRFDMTAPVE